MEEISDSPIAVADEIMKKASCAAAVFGQLDQAGVDRIVRAAYEAGFRNRVRLAKLAHEETGVGNWKDKVIKNVVATQLVYDDMKDLKTVGIISEDAPSGGPITASMRSIKTGRNRESFAPPYPAEREEGFKDRQPGRLDRARVGNGDCVINIIDQLRQGDDMRTLLGGLILAVSSFFCLIPGAESKSPREEETLSGESTFGRHDIFERADANRDGSMDWKEYRDYYRDGTRGDFYRRDRDRDDRLSRDEWKRSDDRNDRWRSWR